MMGFHQFALLFVVASSLQLFVAGDEQCEFTCDDGECVKRLSWCDSVKDCTDESDEKYCETSFFSKNPNKCPPRFFLCASGSCVPKEAHCDGHKDCKDGSDEKNCVTTSVVFPPSTQATQEISNVVKRAPVKHRESTSASEYTPLRFEDYDLHRRDSLNWLIAQRDADFGWGADTPRAIVALFLNRKSADDSQEVDMLMQKQLDIQLSVAVSRNGTHPMSICDLSLYVNALLASCSDPRNFYGHDLVEVLRLRVDATSSVQNINPLAYLTLCVSGATNYLDPYRVKNLLQSGAFSGKIDMLSLSILAASCICETEFKDQIGLCQASKNASHHLSHRINSEGLPGNVYEVSLIIQALDKAEVSDTVWRRSEAMDFLLNEQIRGSFGDILATYHALHALSGKTLQSLRSHCNKVDESDMKPIEVLQNTERKRIFVDYSLYWGHPVEMTQKIQLQIPEGSNCLDIMRLAQEASPNFRFKLDKNRNYPFVYSIGGKPNDAERGLYWKLYYTPKTGTRQSASLRTYDDNLKNLVPAHGDEIVFWRRLI